MSKWNTGGFWEKLRFEYKLSFLNENTLEEVFSFRISRLQGYAALFLFVVFLITLTSFVIIKTPIRNYLPGYLPIDVRQEIIENALRVDSLETSLQIQTQYINNVRAALNGTLEADEVLQTTDSITDKSALVLTKSKESEEFVKNYDEEEKFNLYGSGTGTVDRPFFYCPLKGVLSLVYNVQTKHFGVDIAAMPNEPILAVQKGTVVFAGFVPETGYVIQIQHLNGFFSVYKHCASLLKSQGEQVENGEAIALVGNSGQFSTGAHLHFELWQNGRALNPEEYITFQ